MTSVTEPGPVIYTVGEQTNGDPDIHKALEERLKEILGKFKDSQNIIYVNIENVVLDAPERARSRSRHRSRSRSGSRSRSRSHSQHRKGKHHGRHHSRGPRGRHGHRHHHLPPHFFHRHGRHHFPYHYYSSDVEETSCDITTGAETTEECTAVENCCRGHRRDRRHSRSRSRGGRGKSNGKGRKYGKGCPKKGDKPTSKNQEDQEVIIIDNEEPKNGEAELEKRFDDLNVSKSP